MNSFHAFHPDLTGYLDGGLPPGEHAAVETHLRDCPACVREAESQRALDQRLRVAVARQPADGAVGVRAAVRVRIRAERPPASAEVPIPRWKSLAKRWAEIFPLAPRDRDGDDGGVVAAGPAGGGRRLALATMAARAGRYRHRAPRDGARPPRGRGRAGEEPGWLRGEAEVQRFSQSHFNDPALSATLAPLPYRLTRVRWSRLDGRDYAHFVYAVGDRETVSFFVRRRAWGDWLRPAGGPATVLDRGEPENVRMTGFESGRLRVVVVGDLPPAELLRLAREAASRLPA